jgi:cell wall-associated NlpC family hydrolase
MLGTRRVSLALAAFALAGSLVPVSAPAPARAATTQAATVISFASDQLGKPYLLGATGLRKYDCSGLVYRTFYESGLLNKIGGSRLTARGYYLWFKQRGLASRSNPRKGDLIVWGNGSHIGIYIGNGQAISAVSGGVKVHGVFALTAPLTAYLHVNITR